MFVRQLQDNEILDGLHLVWDVFAGEIAPFYSPQGIAEFQNFIRIENFMVPVKSGEMVVFGAVEEGELCGVSAVRSNGHVALLFVKRNWQRRGVARMLMASMEQYCTGELGLMRMTVNASPNAVEAYRRMGFRDTMPLMEQNGIRFVPMEHLAPPGSVHPQKMGKVHKGLFVGIVACAAILSIFLLLLVGKVIFNISENKGYTDNYNRFQEEMPDEYWDEDDEEESAGSGIQAIRCYEAEELPYEIVEETYTYRSTVQGSEYPMEFDIKYPQIEGLDSGKADEVNEILKGCAMRTVDMLYLNPSDEMKESMLKETDPFFGSQVIYRVTYADTDFISVTFSDHYYAGNYYLEFQDLRTKNIRLSDAQEFTAADIVELDDAFMQDWYQRMQKEAPGAEVLERIDLEEFRSILKGEDPEGRYSDEFFVSADGIEIGLTYHYADGTYLARGWITAPFTLDALQEYRSDSDFWNLVQTAN